LATPTACRVPGECWTYVVGKRNFGAFFKMKILEI